MYKQSDIYDAVVVGGGPAGTSAAIHLAIRGARVLLAEQKRFPRAKLCGEFISPECFEHFQRLGVADEMLEAGGAELSETVFYSRSGASVNVPSEWFGVNGNIMALGLSRAEMDARLLARARDVGVEVLEEARAADLLMEGGRVCGVRLKTCAGLLEVNALMTIDATGRARALARRVEKVRGRGRNVRGANLVAFKAHLENSLGIPGHCEIYFYRGGYGGLSSVEGGLSNLCFIAQARDVRACGQDAERVMREVLMKNARACMTLSQARTASPWLAVALERFGRGLVVPARGMLAVGDAASFIDPFTGSGMLMALESGQLAARCVARHLPSLRRADSESLDAMIRDYRTAYDRVFSARLRMCAMMRRAAFVPRLAEALIFTLGLSERARKGLSRSTRR
jgi:flavin-dependent dehydrogenase